MGGVEQFCFLHNNHTGKLAVAYNVYGRDTKGTIWFFPVKKNSCLLQTEDNGVLACKMRCLASGIVV